MCDPPGYQTAYANVASLVFYGYILIGLHYCRHPAKISDISPTHRKTPRVGEIPGPAYTPWDYQNKNDSAISPVLA